MRKRLLSILLLCALLTGSASAADLPAEDAASPAVLSAGEQITGAGIDVSQFQGEIDWDTTAQYIDFAIIRCGRGNDQTERDDLKWAVNTAACERLGIPYGVYLYSLAQTDEDARSEAAHVLRLLDGKHPQLPVYLDLEDSSIRDNCTKAEVLRHATIFCETLQAAGYSVGIYANRYWWTTTLDDPAYDQWDRWLAVWAAETGYSGSYSTWQNSNSGSIPGIQTNVDLDLRYGKSLRADHTHDYQITEHIPPTCTDFGRNVYTCSGCGASMTQPLRPISSEHVWDTGTVIQQASCAGDGVLRYTCTRCGATRTEALPASPCPSKDLTDVPVPDNWAHAGIDYCVRSGLMSGVGGGRFAPKDTTTRAQVVQILYNLAGEPKVTDTTPFTDLTQDWYKDAVLWAYQTGVVAGTSETTFAPDAPVTREQLAVLLMEYANRVLKLARTGTPADLSRFPDNGSVSSWARDALADAVALGLISGTDDGSGTACLSPQGSATREQTAAILTAFCGNINKG